MVESRIGHGINGRLERSDQLVIYTEAYMSRYRSQVRGLFNAATCPTAVARVIERGDFQEKLFLCECRGVVWQCRDGWGIDGLF